MLGRYSYERIVEAPTVKNIFERCAAPHYNNNSHRLPTHIPTHPEGVIYRVYTGWMEEHEDSWVDLIPSRLELAYTLRQPAQKEHLLAEFISEVEHNYDLILFDCPPTESLFTTAAYLASDYILVPVKPEFLSIIGLPLLARSMG